MQRDIQKILLHWGGWVVRGRTGLGYSSVAAGFKGLVSRTSITKLSCCDEDGLIIDGCIAKLRNVQMEQECDFIECYYAKGMSKRSIGRKYKLNESEVRKRMAIAESFILGCLTAVDEPLELNLLYGFPRHQQRVQPQNAAVLR
ncbi:MAG TPA: antitermination protein Q [Providencia sp.]|uniref:antiterminator Q family protein n=1 Tax=Providencia sp. TaxID=589 RepID=UPI000E913102|nr:antiterminator Q family protein [Providencia sp.]HBO24899.1 antitermination protein Q [Providencia sp.]